MAVVIERVKSEQPESRHGIAEEGRGVVDCSATYPLIEDDRRTTLTEPYTTAVLGQTTSKLDIALAKNNVGGPAVLPMPSPLYLPPGRSDRMRRLTWTLTYVEFTVHPIEYTSRNERHEGEVDEV